MSKFSQTLQYNIDTKLDATGVQKLQSELTVVETKLRNLTLTNSFEKEIAAVQELKTLLNTSFNSKLGVLDLTKLHNQLRTSKALVNDLNSAFSRAGSSGAIAANNIVTRLYKMDNGLRSVSKTTDKIMNTIGNTFRWGVIASAFATIMNSVHDAAKYTSDLDKSLTNIMMVSGMSRDNMNEFAKQANEVAKRLGATTTQMTEATKVFIQQGMSLPESMEMGEYAVHLANISEQDSSVTSDELTALKNAFEINIDDMGNAISKWAAIANNTAVDMEELSVASQKAASVARTVGVDMDQFAAHIAAIEATTREAPENIGNGLKTLYSRLADIKLGETLEDGVDLGQFSSALAKVGVDILDTSGQIKDAGVIVEDLMSKWQSLDQTQRTAVATTVAGRFQLARFEALMNSQGIYRSALSAARNEQGTTTYDRMQETYRDSMQGRMNALTASVEEVFNNLFTTDSFYGAIDAVNGLVDVLNDLIESVGGGSNALSGFGLIFAQIFNTQIARGINNFVQNRQLKSAQQEQVNLIQQSSNAVLRGNGFAFRTDLGPNGISAKSAQLEQNIAQVGRYAPIMTVEQMNKLSESSEKLAVAYNVEAIATADLNEVLKNSGDALKVFYEDISNAEGKIQEMRRTFTGLFNQIGSFTKDSGSYNLVKKFANADIASVGSTEGRRAFSAAIKDLQSEKG